MGLYYGCPVEGCEWHRTKPSICEYPDTDEGLERFAKDMDNFRQEQSNHKCPLRSNYAEQE